jgi:ABC-type glycerol-3-phosphate transport system substrate-binding protein
MKKITLVLMAVLAVLMLMACTTTIIQPVDATTNAAGSKVGEQGETVRVWFNLFPFSRTIDASAYKAAQNGGITKIATVDLRYVRYWAVIFVDETYTAIVTGE